MLDLAWQHRQIAEEVERGFHDVMKTTSFIQGPAVGAKPGAAPIGAHALIDDGLIFLSARVYSPDGTLHITAAHALYLDDDPRPAETVASNVATELLSLGAAELVPAGSIS